LVLVLVLGLVLGLILCFELCTEFFVLCFLGLQRYLDDVIGHRDRHTLLRLAESGCDSASYSDREGKLLMVITRARRKDTDDAVCGKKDSQEADPARGSTYKTLNNKISIQSRWFSVEAWFVLLSVRWSLPA
jgi:hypothetical protein